jgi:hypothetical protein
LAKLPTKYMVFNKLLNVYHLPLPYFLMPSKEIIDDFDFDERDWGPEEGEVVDKFFSLLEAEVAAARLRSEDIPCFLANATSSTVLPHLQIVIRLHVRPEDAVRAREILQEAEAEVPAEKNTKNTDFWAALAVIFGLLLTMFLLRNG